MQSLPLAVVVDESAAVTGDRDHAELVEGVDRSLQRLGLCGIERFARTHVGVGQALDLRLHRRVEVRVGADAHLRRQEGGALAAQHTDLGQLRLYLRTRRRRQLGR